MIVPTATVNMATTLTQPLLLVSDLDDTMTYHSELDHATHQFKQLWDHARGRMDCKLVFNTGRWAAAWVSVLQCLQRARTHQLLLHRQ